MAVTSLASVTLLVGCGSGSDEAERLPTIEELGEDGSSAHPGRTPSPSTDPGIDERGTTDPATGEEEPAPAFTQPYLPEDEPNVVELVDAVEITGTNDLAEEELAVVDDLAEFVADWDAVLFGVPFDDSGVIDTATGDQLETLGTFAAESVDLARVFVGDFSVIRVLDVTVDGEAATVEACLETPGWVQLRDGAFYGPADEVDRSTLGLVRGEGRWLAESSVSGDPAECGAG